MFSASWSSINLTVCRYEAPADFQESEAPLRMQTDATAVAQELWLFQLPHEVSNCPKEQVLLLAAVLCVSNAAAAAINHSAVNQL